MRIILADDAALIREGLAGLLERLGHEVAAQMNSADELVAWADSVTADELPDVVVTDVRMPPTMTDDGLRAAIHIRDRFPDLPIMVLSQYVAPVYASKLLHESTGEGGTGYLLKERVGQVQEFVASLSLVAGGGVVVDKEVASALAAKTVTTLSPREHEVLSLMARGLSNSGIAEELFISKAAVAKHVASIFNRLGLLPHEENRRVRAILRYLADTSVFGDRP